MHPFRQVSGEGKRGAVGASMRSFGTATVAVLLLLAVAGESLYVAVKDQLPKALTAVADKFSLTVTLSVLKDYKPLSLTASLSGILGLALGACLFLAKGVKDVLKLPGT